MIVAQLKGSVSMELSTQNVGGHSKSPRLGRMLVFSSNMREQVGSAFKTVIELVVN